MKSQFLTFTNAVMSEDGWMHVAPLGDFEGIARVPDGKGGVKKFKAIQRIDKEAIAAMLNDQAQNRRGASKYLQAPPLYVGHPDAEPRLYPDHKPKGVFANFKEAAGGMFGEPMLTDEGEAIVAKKTYPGISARFDTEFVNEENGVQIFRPTRFVSAGLVMNPNLPTFLNENMKTDNAEVLNEAISASAMAASKSAAKASAAAKAVTGDPAVHEAAFHAHAAASELHGKASDLAKKDGDDDTAEMHDEMASKHDAKAMQHLKACKACGGKPTFTNESENKLATAVAEAEQNKNDMKKETFIPVLLKYGATITNEAEDSAIITALDQLGQRAAGAGDLQTKLTKAETDFTNERTARINGEIGHALETGRITAAEKPDWERRLKGDFTNESAALVKLTPKVKTASEIKRGDDKTVILNERDRTTFLNETLDNLAIEHKLDRKKDHQRLFKMAQQTRPDLFQAMKRSPLNTPKAA